VKVDLVVSDAFYPLLDERARYLVMCGGRGSGKSEFAARKVLYRCLREGHHRYLIMRKVRKTLTNSSIRIFCSLLAESGIEYDLNKTERIVTFFGPMGMSEVLFDGLDDPEKIKSIKGITGIWLEEATEFSEEDFLKVDLCLREPGPGYKQIMLTFNPQEAEAPWLKRMFFGALPHHDTFVHRSTIEDNPIDEVRETYIHTLDNLKEQDEALWRIARLGEWAAPTGRIYNWDVQDLPTDLKFDDQFIGGDLGYSVDPAAVVRIYRKADDFWLEELVYSTGLTNQDLGARMDRVGVKHNETSYWDAAEPKSIEELRRLGFHALPASKGQDSVRAGIDFLKSKRIHIVTGSSNIVKEHNSYCWRKDRGGEVLQEPVSFDNHAMDAIRYGIFTRCAKSRPRMWSASWA